MAVAPYYLRLASSAYTYYPRTCSKATKLNLRPPGQTLYMQSRLYLHRILPRPGTTGDRIFSRLKFQWQ